MGIYIRLAPGVKVRLAGAVPGGRSGRGQRARTSAPAGPVSVPG